MTISSLWNCKACTVVAVLLLLIGAPWKGLIGSSCPQFSMKYFRDLYLGTLANPAAAARAAAAGFASVPFKPPSFCVRESSVRLPAVLQSSRSRWLLLIR